MNTNKNNRWLPIRVQLCASVAVFCAFAQSPAQFGVADVHPSAHTNSPYMRGPFIRAGRYELRTATMVDLIRTAWGIDEDKVIGGPSWLETDRFDVSAKLPADPTPENLKLLLQSLLEDRFKLVVRSDSRPMPAYVLTVGKKLQIKEADSAGETGCKNTNQGGGRGTGPVQFIVFACRNITMDGFVIAMSTSMNMASMTLNGTPVVNQTELKGAWDFDVKLSPLRIGGGGPETENVTIFDAVDKQLGLKLQMEKIPLPVVVVESVNQKPTENPPGIAQSLPPAPVEFEVADVKPSDPSVSVFGNAFNVQANGRVNLQHQTLKFLIQLAYSLNNNSGDNDTIVGAPKWLDTDRFDVIAKVAAVQSPSGSTANPRVDTDAVWFALRGLLADRFKLAVHFEDQPQPVYALVAVKPKLTKADTSNRSSCKSPNVLKVLTTSGPGGASSANTLTCKNTTMAQLAEQLQQVSMNDVTHPVVDATNLAGAWDFTLTWTPAILGQMAANRAKAAGEASGQNGADSSASDPGGGVSMLQALEKQLGLRLELQKRPMPVLVIDHVNEKPTDN